MQITLVATAACQADPDCERRTEFLKIRLSTAERIDIDEAAARRCINPAS